MLSGPAGASRLWLHLPLEQFYIRFRSGVVGCKIRSLTAVLLLSVTLWSRCVLNGQIDSHRRHP
jgi:hypothetical protein